MKSYIFLSVLLASFLFSPRAWSERELLDRVIAVVNDEPITQSELDMLLKPVFDQFRQEYRGEELVIKLNEARQKLLNQLIEDRLVFQEAESRGIEVDPAEIDQKMIEFEERFTDEMTMEDMLESEGITMNSIRERFRKQAMVRQLHNMEIRSKIVISPKEIEEYYQKNEEKFAQQERIKVRSITIKKSYEAREKGLVDEQARRQMDEVRTKLLAGEDFSKLARENSQDIHAEKGGLSDWLEPGTMIPVIDKIIHSLQLGEISDVIETPMGYHLFRVEEKQQGSKMALSEVREEIMSLLYQQKSEERFYDWMQELKRDAYISIR